MTAPASPLLSMEDTAQRLGLSWERWRKVWREWVRLYRFPPPFERPGSRSRPRLLWPADKVDAWVAGRTAALGKGRARPAPANDDAIPAAVADRVARERALLLANLGRR